MGAHVSACSRTGIETRGNVALWGTFGYELDPNKKYHCPQLNITCSGALLMNAGIDMTELAAWDYQSAKLYFHTVDG